MADSSELIAHGPLPTADQYELALRSIGTWGLVWRRFKRHRLAVIGGWIFVAMVALAIVGQFISPAIVFHQSGLGIYFYQPPRLWPLDLTRLMGLNEAGIPVSAYVLQGGRATLVIGVLGSVIASIIGTFIGGIAGYFGRFADTVLMRMADAFLTVPFLPAIALLALYLPDRTMIPFAILFGLVGWAGIARLMRGYVLSLRQREYADAARALGASDPDIIFRHLLPNALDVIVVSFTLNVAVFIVALASLQFIFAGTTDQIWFPAFSFDEIIHGAWWTAAFPAIPLLLTVLSVNFIGDGLRDALVSGSESGVIRESEQAHDEPPSRAWRATVWVASHIATGIRSGREAVTQPVIRGWQAAVIRPYHAAENAVIARLPERFRPAARTQRTNLLSRLYAHPPLVLQIVPILAVMTWCGYAFLWGHSPLIYSPHFPAPTQLAIGSGENEYGSWPRAGGGWDVFQLGQDSRLTYTRTDGNGHVLRTEALVPGGGGSQPSLAESGGRALGVWVSDNADSIQAAYLGDHPSHPFSLNPASGFVEHPYVVATPRGFDVLFSWERANQNNALLYLVSVPRSAPGHFVPRLLDPAPQYAFYPRGVVDGSGALDVMWLARTQDLVWDMRFRRFSLSGRPLGKRLSLGASAYPFPVPNPPPVGVVPPQWELDMKQAADGTVWAVWDGNDQQSTEALSLAQWSTTGKLLLPSTQVMLGGYDPVGAKAFGHAVQLALLPRGGQLYFTFPNGNGGTGEVTGMQAFDHDGNPVGTILRVNYDGGGSSANPHTATVNGKPEVIWERVRQANAIVEGTSYRQKPIPPDLLTHLGLNVGNLAANILLVVAGALAGGFALGVINPILLIPLILAWLPIRVIVPRPLRLPVYLALIAVLLIKTFASSDQPPGYVILIKALGHPYGWYAVLASIFVTLWATMLIFRRYDPLFRAAATAFTSLYVIGAMYAVIFIQNEITKI